MNGTDGKSRLSDENSALSSHLGDRYYENVTKNVTDNKFLIDGLKHFTLYQIKVGSDSFCRDIPPEINIHKLV